MNHFKRATSLLKINIVRIIDHTYRELTGKPILERGEITSQLYLGGQYKLTGLDRLKTYGITAIVNMRTLPIPHQVVVNNFNTLHLPTTDHTPPTIVHLNKGIAFIHAEINDGGKVYVHCRWGEGRGPSMIIAYLMSTGLFFDDAYKIVKAVRSFIALSNSQIKQLKKFEKTLHIV